MELIRGSCTEMYSQNFSLVITTRMPVSVAAQSKVEVYHRLPAEIVVSNPTGGMSVCLLCVL
jgi:hypothetical protein